MNTIGDIQVLHLSAYDRYGAGGAAVRLHRKLREIGLRSEMLVLRKTLADTTITRFDAPGRLSSRLQRVVRRYWLRATRGEFADAAEKTGELFSDERSQFGMQLCDVVQGCDMVNLHWVADFVDWDSFFQCVPHQKPVVWRLSDMNPFTGGCHYSGTCGRFAESCGACPMLESDRANDITRRVWERKKAALERVPTDRLHLVAQCEWMAEQARASSLFKRFPVTVIPNGVDLDVFTPRPTDEARRAFGIPTEAFVILFVAHRIDDRRKGFSLLVKAWETMREDENVYLISVGAGPAFIGNRARYLNLGEVHSERLLSLIYNTSDVLAVPSMEDNLPNTVLEAMACGVPSVGFAAGGIPEMVRESKTGFAVPVGNWAALGEVLEKVRSAADLRRGMAVNCRLTAVEEYSRELQARRFAELYSTSLYGRRAEGGKEERGRRW